MDRPRARKLEEMNHALVVVGRNIRSVVADVEEK